MNAFWDPNLRSSGWGYHRAGVLAKDFGSASGGWHAFAAPSGGHVAAADLGAAKAWHTPSPRPTTQLTSVLCSQAGEPPPNGGHLSGEVDGVEHAGPIGCLAQHAPVNHVCGAAHAR